MLFRSHQNMCYNAVVSSLSQRLRRKLSYIRRINLSMLTSAKNELTGRESFALQGAFSKSHPIMPLVLKADQKNRQRGFISWRARLPGFNHDAAISGIRELWPGLLIATRAACMTTDEPEILIHKLAVSLSDLWTPRTTFSESISTNRHHSHSKVVKKSVCDALHFNSNS